ncbi:hypothetical protein [Streptomyces heilongjiangensis]|uniref:Serine kinase n=1 Tax=Streptomyces heilongjiangensis TaxID=945052 RepID=A0ABW1BF60_9ACTN|nr:hypothetical protein [Streptomyces heilongjiangensis]MDC2949322.1 hypothetical protein [Streptomyces heilongjiangensis]
MTWYVCRTPGHAVALDMSPDSAAYVRELLGPYVRVATEPGGPGDARWRIATADRKRPAGEEVVITSAAEPPTRLWYDGTTREVLFDPAMPRSFLRHNLVRFTRILLRLMHTEEPEVFLHAGLVARDDGHGALVLGAKRAGKTSTVLSALRHGLRFVGNDDVSVRTDPGGWTGRGWPRRVSVRGDTFAAVGLPGDTDRLLHPAELRALAGGPPLLAEAPVRVLVFPRFHPEPGVVPLGPEETLARLTANELPTAVKHADFLLPFFGPVPPAVRQDLLARLAAQVPGVELRQDFSALHDGTAALTRLLDGDIPVPAPARGEGRRT